ncbi:MAG: hypothetical protein EBS72_10535 [Rhizobiales bacterium]|nr:hypothetical protein [Hyphomicrobiales bacterium]
MRLGGNFGIHRVIALARCRRDHLDVDAHRIEITQALVVLGDHFETVFILRGIDGFGFVIGEMGQRNPGHIDMRLGNGCTGGHDDMRVDIDGRG